MLRDRSSSLEDHERFVARVIEGETVWGIDVGNGFASCPSNDDESRDVIMFWSDRAYAERARSQQYDGRELDSISLFDFLFRWLNGMSRDGVLAGTNWTGDLVGLECGAGELKQEIIDKLPEELFERFRAELQRNLEQQEQSE